MKILFAICLILLSQYLLAQNDRVNDYNTFVWLQTVNTIPTSNKTGVHIEYNWRRTNGVKNWQQSLLRLAYNYKLNENVSIHAGYGWAETFAYGKYPIASNGTFPEHRLYEQLSLKQPINKFILTHRFRVEQRWVGRVKAGTDREIEEWLFLHRFRYQFRTQFNFNKKWYAGAADEIFIGAGKNLGINIFDQNRLFLLVGYKINSKISIEANYFNLVLQQGKKINNQTIMQRNNGFLLSSFANF